jgi:signal transduction histidine kinase/CheY-like chemotaxis protein
MRFLDPNGLVSLIGLLAQTGVTWILALIFALLLKPSGRPAFFVDWTRGLACMAIGLTAVAIRYHAPLLVVEWVEPFRDDGALTRFLLLIYQGCKCLAAYFFFRGATRLARGGDATEPHAGLFWAVLAYAILTALPSNEVEEVLFWQSLLYVPMLFLSGAALWRLPRDRREQGVRITATALQLMAMLWVFYGALTAMHLLGMDLITRRGSVFHALLSHNSYFDLTLVVALSAGMIVLLMQELQRTSRAAQEQRARLELQLERGERLRSLGSLVSTVAHDLNNPLTAVLGFASELERSREGTEDEQSARIVREQAERCRSIVQKLSSLVGDHPAARRLVEPAELLQRVARGMRPRLEEAGLTLEVGCAAELPALYADPYGLEEVLDNLLDNAIHFTPRGGRIRLTAGVEDEMLVIRVRDEGPGVPESLRARIFDPFFSLRREGYGTGIGLAVARGIARAHAGRLELEEPDGLPGASFVLRLPPAHEDTMPEHAGALRRDEGSGAPPAGTRRALVVDDERLVRKVLRRWLQRERWQVEEAEDGDAALALLRSDPRGFDAVLCDLRMPRMTGYALHDRLEAELPEALARTIFITGDLASHEAEAFSRRCLRPIVRKPFDFDELRAELAQLPSAPPPDPAVVKPALGVALLALALPLGGCGGGVEAPSAPTAPPAPAVAAAAAPRAVDAAALYAQHCALCHGPSGDGDGTLVLDRPARSFKQGGFSFGNTEEAIFRTIGSGIGSTPMPGFAQLLDEDERRALARHVIALGPEQVPGAGLASILAVGERPVVVRGQFDALVAGGPEIPRGLLIGNPDGLSYQYRADDVRLLAVRQGPFVDRKDWGERGGLPLEPLGRVIYLADADGDPPPEWQTYPTYEVSAVLRGTSIGGASAVLHYDLVLADGSETASVVESSRALSYAAGSGFVREFLITPADAMVRHRDAVSNQWQLVRIGFYACAMRTRQAATTTIEYVMLSEPAENSFQKLLEEAP